MRREHLRPHRTCVLTHKWEGRHARQDGILTDSQKPVSRCHLPVEKSLAAFPPPVGGRPPSPPLAQRAVLVMRLQALQRAKRKGGKWETAAKVELLPEASNELGPAGLEGIL